MHEVLLVVIGVSDCKRSNSKVPTGSALSLSIQNIFEAFFEMAFKDLGEKSSLLLRGFTSYQVSLSTLPGKFKKIYICLISINQLNLIYSIYSG